MDDDDGMTLVPDDDAHALMSDHFR
jgi:hypothetical protein